MAYGREYERRHRRWRARGRGRAEWWGRWPRRPAHGFPVRGFHTYDLDYGRQAGGPDTDYSGRAGWPTGVPEEAAQPRGAWEYGAWYGYGYGYGPPRRRPAPRFEEWHWAAAEPSPMGWGPRRRRRSRRRGP